MCLLSSTNQTQNHRHLLFLFFISLSSSVSDVCCACRWLLFIVLKTHTYVDSLNVHVSQRFHSNKRIFDYVWLKINSSLRCCLFLISVCVRSLSACRATEKWRRWWWRMEEWASERERQAARLIYRRMWCACWSFFFRLYIRGPHTDASYFDVFTHTLERAHADRPEETLLHVLYSRASKSPVFHCYRVTVFNIVAIWLDVFYRIIASTAK